MLPERFVLNMKFLLAFWRRPLKYWKPASPSDPGGSSFLEKVKMNRHNVLISNYMSVGAIRGNSYFPF